MTYRIERDSLGEMKIDASKYWGAQTQRSLENFPIGKEKMPLEVIRGFAYIKKAAALTNMELKSIEKNKAEAIAFACDQVLKGELDQHFPLAVWQTGSGTQTNMNVNEVVAHIASEELSNNVHPNDDVNKGQSSNDTFPTAMQIATVLKTYDSLLPALKRVQKTFAQLEKRYNKTIKIGRTHLQDATPVTFGQEISGWLGMIEQTEKMLFSSLEFLLALPLGGTAVGTGLNMPAGLASGTIEKIAKWTDIPFRETDNKFHGLTSKDQFVHFHGALKALAANTMKIANDIRWLASGPRTGFGEVSIPANEPGSSIMPGKVNPTQIEALTMVCVQVMGNDTTVSVAASQGNFELNVYMPVIIYNTLQSIELLADGLDSFNERCLSGLEANEERMEELVHQSLMLVTALAPHIGYDQASEIAKKAFDKGMTLKGAALKSGLVTEEEFADYTDPTKMV
jgi:fumarate hydratase class II